MPPCLGKPVKIVDIPEKGHHINFYPERFDEILRNYKNYEVCVLAVAGKCRTGKSTILAYIARKLKCNNLDDLDVPLEGWFKWQAGRNRHTTGIDVWSEPILVNINGVQRVLLLMDTQGVFDCKSTMRENAVIFALATLLSSTLIFNLKTQIREDDLQHLELWVEYGKLALQEGTSKPFQELLFLVRDWEHEEDCNYGQEGGAEYIEDILQVSDDQDRELKTLRTNIKECFSHISCVLLPDPRIKQPKTSFDGRLRGLDDDFIEHLKKFLQTIISEHISVKEVNGKALTGQDMIEYFKEYSKIFQGDKTIDVNPQTIFKATANAHNSRVVDTCIEMYRESMKEIISETITEPNQLTANLRETETKVLQYFNKTRMKIDNDNNRAKLDAEMQEIYKATAIEHNDRLVQDCLDKYRDLIGNVTAEIYETPGALKHKLDAAKAAVLESFDIERVIQESSAGNETKLKLEMDRIYCSTATIHNMRVLETCTDKYGREVEKVTKNTYRVHSELTRDLNAVREGVIMEFEKQHMPLERSANDTMAKLKDQMYRILEEKAIKHNGRLTEECIQKYRDLIDNVKSEIYKAPGELNTKLDYVKAKVLECFDIRRIILEPYEGANRTELMQKMDRIYEDTAATHNMRVRETCTNKYRKEVEQITSKLYETKGVLNKRLDDVKAEILECFYSRGIILQPSAGENRAQLVRDMDRIYEDTAATHNMRVRETCTDKYRTDVEQITAQTYETPGVLNKRLNDVNAEGRECFDKNCMILHPSAGDNRAQLIRDMDRIYEQTADIHNTRVRETCHEKYRSEVKKITAQTYETPGVLNKRLNDVNTEGLECFDKNCMILHPSAGDNRAQLIRDMDRIYEETADIHNTRVRETCHEEYRSEVKQIKMIKESCLTQNLEAVITTFKVNFKDKRPNQHHMHLLAEECRHFKESLETQVKLVDLNSKFHATRTKVLTHFDMNMIPYKPAGESNRRKLEDDIGKAYEDRAKELNTELASQICRREYESLMHLGDYTDPKLLQFEHLGAKGLVLKYFDMQCVKDLTSVENSKNDLENELEQHFKYIATKNDNNKPWYKTTCGKVLIGVGIGSLVLCAVGGLAIYAAPCIATKISGTTVATCTVAKTGKWVALIGFSAGLCTIAAICNKAMPNTKAYCS